MQLLDGKGRLLRQAAVGGRWIDQVTVEPKTDLVRAVCTMPADEVDRVVVALGERRAGEFPRSRLSGGLLRFSARRLRAGQSCQFDD